MVLHSIERTRGQHRLDTSDYPIMRESFTLVYPYPRDASEVDEKMAIPTPGQ